MKRDAFKLMQNWKASPHRKPLIIKGVRQCGKTWLLKTFGEASYASTAYFNFDEQPELKDFFETTKDTARLLQNLSFAAGFPIKSGETLIVFDEIQECNAALNSLKYFCENAPEYHIACAGSLLGVALSRPQAFPVGKVDFLELYPMTFMEFLSANGDDSLRAYADSISSLDPVPELFASQLTEKLRMYMITGGMPEAVRSWTEERDVGRVQVVLMNLLDAYERDFAKHADAAAFPKLSLIWGSIPSQLSRENKKFLYKAIKEGSRAREYEDALFWLMNAGLIRLVHRVSKPALPLSAYSDNSAFKAYACDVGLLRRQARLAPSAFTEGDRLFTEFKGALSENFALQSLIPQLDTPLMYWSDGKSRYEVDFIIQLNNDMYPLEVKSSGNVESKSLRAYSELFPDATPLRVRLSMLNLKKDGLVLNIPLYLADHAVRLIRLAGQTGISNLQDNTRKQSL